ncbi:MAG: hypothetical protein ACE5R6_11020 [Candidatus Heimdallarchaeota archaeon]
MRADAVGEPGAGDPGHGLSGGGSLVPRRSPTSGGSPRGACGAPARMSSEEPARAVSAVYSDSDTAEGS